MKKILFTLLLPLFGFAQVDLVQWNGQTHLAPTIQSNNITAGNFTGSGLSTGPVASWDGIIGLGWPTEDAIDLSKYFQVTVSSVLNGSFTINTINMGYKGNCKTYEIRYSKSADFSNPVTIIKNTSANFYISDIDTSLTDLNIAVGAYETLYIRFYAYNRSSTSWDSNGNWKIRNLLNIKGTINSSPTALNGTYTIGSTPGSHFPTITSAVSALNMLGVNGATTFLLDNSVYNRSTNEIFPIIINSYSGNTAYPVTFKPNAGKQVLIESTNFPAETNTPAVFKINGADNITFDGSNNGTTSKNLTIYNDNPLNQQKAVIWLASENSNNGASNTTVKNLTLQQNTRDQEVSFGVFAAGSGSETELGKDASAAASNSANTISNVTFTKVGQAIFVNGSSTNPSSGWKIKNNVIGGNSDADKPFLGIYLNNTPNYEISGNSIVGVLKNTTSYEPIHSGIIVTGTSNGSIFNNIIRDVYNSTNNKYCAGIYINSSNNYVYNNMISNVRGNNSEDGNYNIDLRGHGIYMNGGNNNKFYYNTIYMIGDGNSNKRSSCLYLGAGTAVEVKNNIFYNAQDQGFQYGIYLGIPAAQLTSDYNDFVAQYAVHNNGNDQSFGQWKSDSSKDLHSISVIPQFISATNIHIDNTLQSNIDNFDGKGAPIATYLTDIDGEIRNINTPDIGADEFAEVTTTWNGTSWSHGIPFAGANAIISGAYNTALNGTFTAKRLLINPQGSIVIKSGTNITVVNQLVNNAAASSFVVECNANLIQSGLVNLNSGSIEVKRDATMRRFDYVYWSAPVMNQNLQVFSPQTVSNRFFGLDEATNLFVWVDPSLNSFQPANGYLVRAPNNFPTNGNQAVFNGKFTGKPNSGNYTIDIFKSAPNKGYNLIGNPYPSTLSADAFMAQNPTIQTLYFWSHMQLEVAQGTNYATYNLTGGTGTSKTIPVSEIPNGIIQTGQGFLVKTNANATVTFTNSMRVTNNAGQFFRSSANFESNRIWLNLSKSNNLSNQILVGYITNATNGLDSQYDGKLIETTGSRIYNVIDDSKYAIQGRALPFTNEDIVPLGFITDTAGDFTIGIDHLDGLFLEGQQVFLKDNLTNSIHNLSESAYDFASNEGTFNSRFTILYQNSTLGIDDPVLDENSIIVFTENQNLKINAGKTIIASVQLFDIRGRMIMEKNKINSTETSLNPSIQKQVLLVKITTEDNKVFTRKVIY